MQTLDVQELLTEAKYYKGAVNGKSNAAFLKAVDNILTRNAEKLYGDRAHWSPEREVIGAGQLVLRAMGYLPGNVDGWAGPKTAAAYAQWKALDNKPTTPAPTDSGVNAKFDPESAARVAKVHPKHREFLNAARDKIAFYVSDSTRGRKAQEDAFRRGASKVHFGNSAHNYSPAIAVDVWPKKNVDWGDIAAFKALQKVFGWYNPATGKGAGLAKSMKIPMRWGGDWNMDGSDKDGWDLPHYELHPWRDWAKQSKLFEG